jgi:hypothetical protein
LSRGEFGSAAADDNTLPADSQGEHEVRIDLTVPDEEIAVTHEPNQHTAYKDICVAIRDAFDSARRKLEDYMRRRRGAARDLETAPHARGTKLFS